MKKQLYRTVTFLSWLKFFLQNSVFFVHSVNPLNASEDLLENNYLSKDRKDWWDPQKLLSPRRILRAFWWPRQNLGKTKLANAKMSDV